MRRYAKLFFMTFVWVLSFQYEGAAQTKTVMEITVMDALTSEKVEYATVSSTDAKGGKIESYAVSDADGHVCFEGLASGSHILKAELLGYEPADKKVVLGKSEVRRDTLYLNPSKEALEAATISAAGNNMVIKKDTVEYNAGSYLMTDNDLLEDLLKKLPGVEVDDDGKVLVNGEKINKITIGGKMFFLNDPKLATKNIPAKYIKKIKVIEKKSEQAEFTGIDDGERETVIDLDVGDKMGKGLFGNIMGGVGHDVAGGDFRFQGSAFVGQFNKKRQLSLVANGNNTNNKAVTDLSGKTVSSGNNGGISTSYMAGANGAWTLFDGRMDVGGNYVFNDEDNVASRHIERVSFLKNRNLEYSSDEYNISDSHGHRIGGRLEHKFNKSTSILFEPSIDFGRNISSGNSVYSTMSVNETETWKSNDGFRDNSAESSNVSTSGRFLFRQRLGLPGRTMTVLARYSFRHNDADGTNSSRISSYTKSGDSKDSLLNQTYTRVADNASASAKLTYTEPLGAGFYVEGDYTFSWSHSNSEKKTYDDGETFNPLYSNEVRSTSRSSRFSANLRYQKGKTKGQLGIALVPVHFSNETVKRGQPYELNTNVFNWAPQFSFSTDPSDNLSARLTYFGRSEQPSTSDLMPVPDVGNPLNVKMGNPYLSPSFNHAVKSVLRWSKKKQFIALNFRANVNVIQNPVVTALWYGTNGVQYSMPVNGPVSWNTNVSLTFNAPLVKGKLSVTNYLNVTASSRESYVGSEKINLDAYYDGGTFDFDKFHEDNKNITDSDSFSRNKTTGQGLNERISLRYHSKSFEAILGVRTNARFAWYSIKDRHTSTWNNNLNASVNYNWRRAGLAFDSQFSYNWYNGYSSALDDEFLLNARLSKVMFKKKVTAAISATDILNQVKSMTVTDNANQHREVRSNSLGRYIIGTLTWRFGKGYGGRQR